MGFKCGIVGLPNVGKSTMPIESELIHAILTEVEEEVKKVSLWVKLSPVASL